LIFLVYKANPFLSLRRGFLLINTKYMKKKLQIAVIGSAGKDDYKNEGGSTSMMECIAENVGFLLASNNAIVVTGGKSGIMNAAARGAKKAGGVTVGVVKGKRRFTSNEYTDVEVISGMEADGFDEVLLTFMCDASIVVGGGAGTLEEIALMYRNNKPMILISNTGGWADKLSRFTFIDERKIKKLIFAESAEAAVKKLFTLLD
jgi:uncharacterized protein (TIGR00725 family)